MSRLASSARFVHSAREWALALLLALVPATLAAQAPTYFPGLGDSWERREPTSMGFDLSALQSAVDFAIANESSFGPDLETAMQARLGDDPLGEILGPMKARAPANGMILRDGYIVAEWGDTRSVDMTFSISKSYLSSIAGLAWDEGRIESLSDRIARTVPGEHFESDHNRKITWHMLLQQRSEWEGTLWGKPDVADRRAGRERILQEPGTFWEYNDVRVNLAAYALLRIMGEPLPDVLRDRVMNPIGASDTWEWHGYRTSLVELDGRAVTSVSGGGHWGGGVWISTRDHARYGYLFLRRGRWAGRRILSEDWVKRALEPADIKPDYGYMWWLNTDRARYPAAPESSFFALGGGTNVIWVDPDHDLVVVVRWIEGSAVNEFMALVMAALEAGDG